MPLVIIGEPLSHFLLTGTGALSSFRIIIVDPALVSFNVAAQFSKFEIEPNRECSVGILIVGILMKIGSSSIGLARINLTIRIIGHQ